MTKHLWAQPRTLFPENEDCVLWQSGRFQRSRARQVINADKDAPPLRSVLSEGLRIRVVAHVHVPIGDHGSTPVPAPTPNYVHAAGPQPVRGADDGTNVEVVTQVLDRHLIAKGATGDVFAHGIPRPVTVLVLNIAAISFCQQLRVPVRAHGRVALPGAHAARRFGQCPWVVRDTTLRLWWIWRQIPFQT